LARPETFCECPNASVELRLVFAPYAAVAPYSTTESLATSVCHKTCAEKWDGTAATPVIVGGQLARQAPEQHDSEESSQYEFGTETQP
jgi:hypothetical protein